MSHGLIERFEFPTRKVLQDNGYNVFPEELEDDESVFFHATATDNVDGIFQNGLQPGINVGKDLHTISFADRSVWALTHWVNVRDGREGVILALRFASSEELRLSGGTYYSLELKSQPTIIAICPVALAYEHV